MNLPLGARTALSARSSAGGSKLADKAVRAPYRLRFMSRSSHPAERNFSSACSTVSSAWSWASNVVKFGSCIRQPQPDMFFYGFHGIEPLNVLMGTGCESVRRVQTQDTDVVTGVWKYGRVGTNHYSDICL